MFDMTWGNAGLTIYWPDSSTNYPGGQYPTTYPTPYPVAQGTTISTGMLLVIGLLAYVLLTKKG